MYQLYLNHIIIIPLDEYSYNILKNNNVVHVLAILELRSEAIIL